MDNGAEMLKWCQPALQSPCCSEIFKLFYHRNIRKWVGQSDTGGSSCPWTEERYRNCCFCGSLSLFPSSSSWRFWKSDFLVSCTAGSCSLDNLDFLSIRGFPLCLSFPFSICWYLPNAQWVMEDKCPIPQQWPEVHWTSYRHGAKTRLLSPCPEDQAQSNEHITSKKVHCVCFLLLPTHTCSTEAHSARKLNNPSENFPKLS